MQTSITRDIKLLFAGALISFCSTIAISYLNNAYADKKEEISRKYAIVERMVQGMESRIILINDLYNAKNDLKNAENPANRTSFDTAYKKSSTDRQNFEAASVVYIAELNKFFKKEDKDNFLLLYSNTVKINLFVELDNDTYVDDKTYKKARTDLEAAILPFAEKLYNEVD